MADPTASSIAKSTLISIVNKGLVIASAWLVSKGILDPGTLSANDLLIVAAGIAGFLISIGWTVFTKIRTWYLVEAAKNAAPSDSMKEIKAEAKSKSPI